LIWEFSLPSKPRLIKLSPESFFSTTIESLNQSNPVALSVCYESRLVALKRYKLCFDPPIYVDFSGGDILYYNGFTTFFADDLTPICHFNELLNLKHLCIGPLFWYNIAWLQRINILAECFAGLPNLERVSLHAPYNSLYDNPINFGSTEDPYFEDPFFQAPPIDAPNRHWAFEFNEILDYYKTPSNEEIERGVITRRPEIRLTERPLRQGKTSGLRLWRGKVWRREHRNPWPVHVQMDVRGYQEIEKTAPWIPYKEKIQGLAEIHNRFVKVRIRHRQRAGHRSTHIIIIQGSKILKHTRRTRPLATPEGMMASDMTAMRVTRSGKSHATPFAGQKGAVNDEDTIMVIGPHKIHKSRFRHLN